MKSIAAVYSEYGTPSEVLRAETIDVPAPKRGQALVRLLRAVINPSDLGMIAGSYGRLKNLPAVGGREGIGVVEELGEGTTFPPVGSKVKIPEDAGVWSQYSVCEANDLFAIPSDLPDDICSMAFINPPTALCILDNFAELKPGDWFIQNGAGSAVGYFAIQICASRGIKTANILRNSQSKRESLEKIGATLVIDESDFDYKAVKELCGGGAKLGLNQIGGTSVSNMIKAVGNSATIVTIGGMTGEPIRFPTRFLIFNDLRLRGFWWDKWKRTHSREDTEKIYSKVFDLIRNGTLSAPVDSVFEMQNVREAVARASENSRNGKVLLKF